VIPDDDPVLAVFPTKLFLQPLMNPVGEIRRSGDGGCCCYWRCCRRASDRGRGWGLRKQARSQRRGANAEED